MSGDVQPRKRKDKKRKKDELVVEEPRGTAAALGEGDVFMHSYHDHGTGGHWCAKIIFFSLLAILLTLIGLIILENRGLSELEANAVESRYSGVLDGWLEDAPDDDHHDEHTLELNHPVHSFKETSTKDGIPEDHDDEETESNEVDDGDNDDEHGENYDDDHENELSEEEDDDELQESQEDNEEVDDEQGNVEQLGFYARYFGGESTKQVADRNPADSEENNNDEENNSEEFDEQGEDDDEANNDNENEREADDDDEDSDEYNEENDDDDDSKDKELNDDDEKNNYNSENDELEEPTKNGESQEYEDDDEHDEHDDEDDDHDEVEHIEKDVSEEEPLSLDLPVLPEADDDKEDSNERDDDGSPEEDNEDEEFLEQDADDDDDDEPIVERITAPAGKPFVEIDDDDLDSTQKSPDTLEEEEEYEKKQEELRREEEEQGSNMWLKLSIGGALLAATQAVVRRAATPRDAVDVDDEEIEEREETPVTEDRRMTLIPEYITPVTKKVVQDSSQPVQEQAKKIPFIIKSAPTPKQASLEDEEVKDEMKQKIDKEMFSDDEEEEEKEVVKPAKKVSIQSAAPKQSSPEPESDDDVPDDVEIIDEEQIEEELAEEDDEEDISDVDDAELLTRLEAKYGRLPEPERFGPKPKDGGKSVANQWPGEPSDTHWRQQLDTAEDELIQGAWLRALERTSKPQLSSSGRARWISARALDLMAEAKRDNALLTRAINAYVHLLKMNEGLSDRRLIEVSSKALERIKFRGNYISAEPVYRMLIRRFPKEPVYRNNLTISFLMAGRSDLAERVLKETLELWPEDRVALAHYGFILKTEHKRYEEAIDMFQKALEGDSGPASEPRFYYHFGDSLLLLGRFKEAHEVHKRGAALGHFLSPAQRSLYNVERLKSQPWWDVSTSPYSKLARALEKSWREILKEGEAARALFEKENEGLKERGDWTQMDLYVRGREIPGRCKQAPVTCSIIKAESGGCSRGQVKFSAMVPGTHVRPHVGPTNCRLRMHLGLSNTKDTYLRVDKETRQWQLGKVLMFDDSFEHEVWHNGTGTRLVLIVDVWHPDLTPAERRQLPPI